MHLYLLLCLSTADVDKPLTVNGRLDNEAICFLIDIGASCSILYSAMVAQLNCKIVQPEYHHHILTANGTTLQTGSQVVATVQLASLTTRHKFAVSSHLPWSAVLGMDFLRRYCDNIDPLSQTIGFLYNAKNTRVEGKPQTVNILEASDNLNGLESILIQPLLTRTASPYTERLMLASLLRSLPDVFQYGSEEPERTGPVHHEIDTGDHHPLRQPARRIPVHYQSQLNTLIQDMLNKRVIRLSTSLWASPIVLVKKKDGSLRLCVDYRRLNAITKRDSFSLPRIDTTLDALHGAKWFPTLDLDSGYRQVKVRPADRQKKAFIIPSVLYGFETMPFDLANAPANFQRILQTVSQDLVPSQCLIYLDDITVHAPTIDEHNSRLKNVFERLRMAGLKLKPTKCVLLMQEVSFLGHLTTPAGVKTDGKKVKQIVDWPVPRSYRKFVQYFAETASPLYQPMEKGKKFVWSAECHAAFNTLEDKLSSPPILAFPDFSPSDGPFLLDTDASDLAIGAVLSQKPANGEVVIAYASRRLDKRKRRYCTTRR
ncbi:uncharacterized protein DEA37_0007304 [Paragonimus westermani]|uniref:Reverse transcriptase domain-containing protein n=1 Tax=Paragonimus westermani TaxID=34504 RepID=A0A5J4NT23_9TREM|nr:uncharacterized protein DEA37_0007304 [Paragonimus westermani]